MTLGRWKRRLKRALGLEPRPNSDGYKVIDRERARRQRLDGWHTRKVAETQRSVYRKMLERMYSAGKPVQRLEVGAEAIRLTGLADPSILEVGCGSGYYYEALTHLLGRPIRYTGLDYSYAMVELGRKAALDRRFVQGDATALPFTGSAFDIVFNGGSLMHILDYQKAIAESRRVARRWCVFHLVAVLAQGPTAVLRKYAYGGPTVEVVFNEDELRRLLQAAGLEVRHVLGDIPYDLQAVLGQTTCQKTYVCQVAGTGPAA